MPSNSDFIPLVTKLLTRTRENKVVWKGTYEADTFVCVLEGGFTFQVERGASNSRKLEMTDSASATIFRMRAVEPDPETDQDNDQQWEPLEELWERARRAALDIDKKVNEASKILDKI